MTRVVWLCCFVGISTIVRAQALDLSDRPFAQAAMSVLTFEHLQTRCRGMSTADSTIVSAWHSKNGIALIQSRIAALEQTPAQKRLFDQARTLTTETLSRQPGNMCNAMVSLTRVPIAQIASNTPELLTALREVTSSGGAPVAVVPVGTAPQRSAPRAPVETTPRAPVSAPVATPVATPAALTALLAQIESFGFDTRMTMGVGGFMGLDVFPVVLFKNGDALKDVEGLSFTGGLAAHRRAKPNSWTRWRRSGGKLQLATTDEWSALAFQVLYPSLPADFRLNGRFRSLSGAGNAAIGGTQSVAAWRVYAFTPDGRVVRDNGAGGGSADVAVSSVAPSQRGRYRTDGLVLHITYDDGSRESRILITNPNDPKSAIWLDGTGYTRR